MSKKKIRTKSMTLGKFIWYSYQSDKKHGKRMKKKLNTIVDYHVEFMSAGGWWTGKQ